MRFIINDVLWSVELVPAYSTFLMRSDGSRTVGVTDAAEQKVYLSNSLYGKFLKKVFVHEVCHCGMFSYGIYMPIEYEEILCNFVADHGEEIFDIVSKMICCIERIA